MEQLGEKMVIVDSWIALGGALLFIVVLGWLLYTGIEKYVFGTVWSKRQRRRRHYRHVRDVIVDLRYKIINLTLACERGDISETAFLRRTMNAAKLIRRYEVKKSHLNRLVK